MGGDSRGRYSACASLRQVEMKPPCGNLRHPPLMLHTLAVFISRLSTPLSVHLQKLLKLLTTTPNRICRTIGTIFGMGVCNAILWYYWPEAHGFFLNPLGIFLCGTALLCDMVYPFALWQVRKTEVALPDGRLVSLEQFDHMQTKGKKRL